MLTPIHTAGAEASASNTAPETSPESSVDAARRTVTPLRSGERLKGYTFARVFASPLQRAARTCELAGFAGRAEIDRDLVEWNYGDYEGLRSAGIHAIHANWDPFRDGFPDGDPVPERRAAGYRSRRQDARIDA